METKPLIFLDELFDFPKRNVADYEIESEWAIECIFFYMQAFRRSSRMDIKGEISKVDFA